MTWTQQAYTTLADVKQMLDPNMTTADDGFLTYLIPVAQANLDSELGYSFQQDGSSTTGAQFRTSVEGNNGVSNSTSFTLATPKGTMQNDVLIAVVAVTTAGQTITPPTGWNLIRRQDTGSASTASYSYVVPAAIPSSFTWTFSSAGLAVGFVADYYGVDTAVVVDASNPQFNASSSSVSNAGVTTSYANDLLIFGTVLASVAAYTPPTGYTEESEAFTASLLVDLSQAYQATAGATGTVSGTASSALASVTHLIALKASTVATAATRTYNGCGCPEMWVDDLVSLSAVNGVTETYYTTYLAGGTTWIAGAAQTTDITADIILKPSNAVSMYEPYHKLVRNSGLEFAAGVNNYAVSGVFGQPYFPGQMYPGVPDDISRATARLVIHYYKMRDTAYANTIQSQGNVRMTFTQTWPADVLDVIHNYQRMRFATHARL